MLVMDTAALPSNPSFTRLYAQVVQENGAFTVNVQMLHHLKTTSKAWNRALALQAKRTPSKRLVR